MALLVAGTADKHTCRWIVRCGTTSYDDFKLVAFFLRSFRLSKFFVDFRGQAQQRATSNNHQGCELRGERCGLRRAAWCSRCWWSVVRGPWSAIRHPRRSREEEPVCAGLPAKYLGNSFSKYLQLLEFCVGTVLGGIPLEFGQLLY